MSVIMVFQVYQYIDVVSVYEFNWEVKAITNSVHKYEEYEDKLSN